jgi:hypothetical protein
VPCSLSATASCKCRSYLRPFLSGYSSSGLFYSHSHHSPHFTCPAAAFCVGVEESQFIVKLYFIASDLVRSRVLHTVSSVSFSQLCYPALSISTVAYPFPIIFYSCYCFTSLFLLLLLKYFFYIHGPCTIPKAGENSARVTENNRNSGEESWKELC